MIFSTEQIQGFLGQIKPKSGLPGLATRAEKIKAFREKRIEMLIERFGPGVEMRCDDMGKVWGVDYRAASSFANRLADDGVLVHFSATCPKTNRPRSVYQLTNLALEGRGYGEIRCLN